MDKPECRCIDCNLPDLGIEKLGWVPPEPVKTGFLGLNANIIKPEQPTCKTCKGFGDKYCVQKGIMIPCPDCEPEQPNQNLMIIKTIQGLMSVIDHNLSKLQKAVE